MSSSSLARERFMTDMYDFAYALVRISPQTLTALAEEYTGLPPGSMRIESMAPVSRAARARWSRTSAFICCQLLDSPSAGISSIVAKEMTRLAAATVLDVFPSTAMTAAHTPGPSRVPPATARRAAAFSRLMPSSRSRSPTSLRSLESRPARCSTRSAATTRPPSWATCVRSGWSRRTGSCKPPTPPPVRQSQPSPAAGAGPAQRALLPLITGSTGKRLASHCAPDEVTYDADDVAFPDCS